MILIAIDNNEERINRLQEDLQECAGKVCLGEITFNKEIKEHEVRGVEYHLYGQCDDREFKMFVFGFVWGRNTVLRRLAYG